MLQSITHSTNTLYYTSLSIKDKLHTVKYILKTAGSLLLFGRYNTANVKYCIFALKCLKFYSHILNFNQRQYP